MLYAHLVRIGKRWLLLPVSAGAFIGLACQQEVEPSTSSALNRQPVFQAPVYEQVAQTPMYPGGSSQLLKDLHTQVKPLFPSTAAKAADLNGKVLIDYVVDAAGIMRTAIIKQAVTPEPGQEIVAQQASEAALKAVQGLKAHWKPGYQNGGAVAVRGTLTLIFQSQPYTITGGSHKPSQGKWYSLIWLVG